MMAAGAWGGSAARESSLSSWGYCADVGVINYMRAIDRLLKVAGTDRKIYKEVDIRGEDFSFWMKPLTIAEQQSAQKSAKSDDANDFAIQLLIKKAQDENGAPMFQADAGPMLRNAIEKSEVEKLLLALIREDEEDAPELDMKSLKKAAKD
tara:strand:- start:2427 stop:2879 length:453 start_codon:yes stop_codon:yes gene_type:complete